MLVRRPSTDPNFKFGTKQARLVGPSSTWSHFLGSTLLLFILSFLSDEVPHLDTCLSHRREMSCAALAADKSGETKYPFARS